MTATAFKNDPAWQEAHNRYLAICVATYEAKDEP